jgi:hypothetical protein
VVEHSYGGRLEYSDDALMTTPIEVTNVRTIDPEDLTITKTMTHHLRSLNAVKTRIPGMIEDGDLVCEIMFDEDKYDLLHVIAMARSEKHWRFTAPGGSTLKGPGFISVLGRPRSPDDDVITFSLRVSPTGGWAYSKTGTLLLAEAGREARDQ